MKVSIPILLFVITVYCYSEDIKPINLGIAINSSCEELNPIISPDGRTIFFCRSQCRGNYGKDDIWYSSLDSNGNWAEAKNLGPQLNTSGSNYVCSASPDGNTILVVTEKETKWGNLGGLFLANRSLDGWDEPERIEIEDFTNYSQYAGFYLANDGKTLVMTIEDDSSLGEKDLYVSFRKTKNKWSTPMHLGAVINSKGDEISPFLASDGRTLYFSSDGHKGFGRADLFVSRRIDDSWKNWTEPVNFGPEINTYGWDAYYKADAQGEYAYFVSENRSFGKSDIFKVKIPEHLRPDAVLLVKGKITNAKSLVPLECYLRFENHEDEIIGEGGKFAGQTTSDSIFGVYAMTLPIGSYYDYHASADGFIDKIGGINLRKTIKYTEYIYNIEMIPNSDSLILIRNIFFERNSTSLTADAKKEIRKAAEFLEENPMFSIQVVGHTDDTGPADLNLKISQKRANKASAYMRAIGISDRRIIQGAKGEREPVIQNLNDEYRQLNRRVEFKIVIVEDITSTK